MTRLAYHSGKYQTVTRRVSWLGKIFPSLTFYAKGVSIVVRHSRMAHKGLYNDQEWENGSCELINALESVGVTFSVTGAEHLASLDGACVIIGNHMSALETFALPGLLLPFMKITFIVKKSLVDYPLFKHVIRASKPIVVSRTNPREDLKTVMEQGVQCLHDTISVVVFPQTTRTTDFDPSQFNTIGIKLAKRAKVPVVPVALKTDAWENGKVVKDLGRIMPGRKVSVAFGAPLEVQGNGQEEHAAVISFIQTHLQIWRSGL